MTTEQKIVQLKRWEAAYRALQKNYDSFCQLTGAGPDAPLFKPVWGMFERYTNSVAALVDDNNGWLDWYCWECGMGDSPMKAVFGDEEFIVDDIDKLMRCIDFDRNNSERSADANMAAETQGIQGSMDSPA